MIQKSESVISMLMWTVLMMIMKTMLCKHESYIYIHIHLYTIDAIYRSFSDL